MIANLKSQVTLAGQLLGTGPPMIVAEIGGNHGGDPDLARRMIAAAARSGVDAVKLQVYRTDGFVSRQSQYFDELAREELGPEAVRSLKSYADELGIPFIASVFDPFSLALVAEMKPAALKIASGDIDYRELQALAAETGLPLILSTGAADLEEIDGALETLATSGAREVLLLQCTALYPCPEDQTNLAVIPALAMRYGIPVGFSDHTLGSLAPLTATAVGAVMIEKHFTIDRRLPGGDNAISCLPDEMTLLIQEVGRVFASLGKPEKKPTPEELLVRPAIRRGLVAARDMAAGTTLGTDDLIPKRTTGGAAPAVRADLLGRTTLVPLIRDEPVTKDRVR